MWRGRSHALDSRKVGRYKGCLGSIVMGVIPDLHRKIHQIRISFVEINSTIIVNFASHGKVIMTH